MTAFNQIHTNQGVIRNSLLVATICWTIKKIIDNILVIWTPDHQQYMTEEQRLEKYGRCSECNQPNTYNNSYGNQWCKSCNASHFRNVLSTWTSENAEIDYLIQNSQIHAWSNQLILEWYPWELFSEIEKIGEGGYGTVFRAKMEKGRIMKWDHENNQCSRGGTINVALKTIKYSKDFLKEVIYIYY